MSAPAGELPSLGGSLALSFVSLGVVCLAAFLVLRLLGRRGLGRGAGALKVIDRCPLEPRRSVYLIEAAGRCFLVGVGDGPMSLLAEVERSQVSTATAAAEDQPAVSLPSVAGRFADVLVRARDRGRAR